MISGNMVGMYSTIGKTLVLTDENGNEVTGVIVDQEVIFTAGDNDVREGKIYASDEGVSTGTKNIPSYHTSEGYKVIDAGSNYVITLHNDALYDYTKLQVIICPFNTSLADSVSTEMVSMNDNVYDVLSVSSKAVVTKDADTQSINLGITNETEIPYIIRYFTYKEII